MQGQSTQQKQKFLRDEIIGKEFDADEFMQFMGRVKNEGQNIDLQAWTMVELKTLVQKYKEYLNRGRQEMMSSRISKSLQQTKIFQPAKKERVKYEGTNLWDYEMNDKQECSKAQLAFEFPANTVPRIEIEKFEMKSVGGFIFGIGSRNELQLVIRSNFTAGKVVRKVQDCDWLKSILTLKHPGCYVPPLQKSREMASDDKKGIAARAAEVGQFLNALLDYPCFHYSNYFKEFLCQQDYKRFTTYKNRESAFAVERDFIEIETPSGWLNVQLNDKLNQSLKKASQTSNQLSTLYGELSGWVNKVTNDMEALQKSLRCLNDAANRMGEKLNEVQSFFHYQDLKLPTILLSVNSSNAIIAKNLKAHAKALAQFNETFLKSAVRDWNEFVTFDRRHQGETKSYLSAKEALQKRKEKCAADPLKWELPEAQLLKIQKQGIGKMTKEEIFQRMFPNENDKEHRTRIWLSFVHQNYLGSFKQFLIGQEKIFLNNYLIYAKRYLGWAQENSSTYRSFQEMFEH